MTPSRIAPLVLALCALACSDWREPLREATYGPSFEYISPEQLQSTMWQMARDVSELEALLARPGTPSEADRQRALALLDAIHGESERLGSEGARTNHPLLDRDRDRFRADVATARRGVASEPPSYEVARTVSTSCVHCHGRRLR